MAEAALFGIAKSVLQQLASPALDEFKLLWGHKEEFQKLVDTVTTIQNVLQDADPSQSTDATVQGWIARLRAVLYDADDFFDAISAKVLLQKAKKGNETRKKVRRFVSNPSRRFATLFKKAHKVKEIRERFDDIAADINKFNFLPITTELAATSRIQREETGSFVTRNEVVGREQETEEVVRMLLSDSSQQQISSVCVIAVIGYGGLGKTTLAQLVYNDEKVKYGFNLFMWVCINNISDQKQVLITLLKSVTGKEPGNLNLDQLQLFFKEEIKGKRFLLVLDDVCDVNPQSWRKLKELLSSGSDGSKVLATTRSKAVAKHLWAIKPYFFLQVLSDESSWLLFKKIAFEDEEDRNDSELEKLGRPIERQCANVPLAIVTIATLMRVNEKERWPLVNDELSKLFPRGYDNIMQVLEFSYKELPYPIKRCFGYCSLFPKDYKFDKDSLVRLWIAQGFVEPSMNKSLEEGGEEYFFCLVDRCFFHRTTRYRETYLMHDLIHDLAIKVAGSENILVDHTPQGSWDKKVRHVSITCEVESIVDHVCSFPHSKSLRTFIGPRGKEGEKYPVKKLMSSFMSLRVLVWYRIEEVPASIGNLIHLRYLDLSDNDMKRLPSSICGLCHLQSLILQECKCLEEFPEDLGELIQLRYLDLSRSHIKKLPSSICALRHLEYLILQECKCLEEFPEDLGELIQLKHLDLSRSHMKRLPSSICGLRHLKSLILRSCGRLEELPEDFGGLLKLRHLVLEGCHKLVISMSTLASLVILDKLELHIPSGALNYLENFLHFHFSLQIVLPLIESENSKTDAERSFLSRESRLRTLSIFCEIRLDTEMNDIRRRYKLLWGLFDDFTRRGLRRLNLFREPATANSEVNAAKEINEERSLSQCQLPPNVAYLRIIYFGGKEIPHWVSSLNKLVTLKLNGCERCVKLPPLSDLPSLRELEISGMSSMLTIQDINFYKPNSFFLSLQTLSILSMSNLTSWWMQAPTVLPTFPHLTKVKIFNCPNLTRCLPLFPLVEDLQLVEVREEIIWQIIGSEATSTGTSHGNNVLERLEIRESYDLCSITEAQISHLSALQHLTVLGCNQLQSIALNGLAYLTSLEYLEITTPFRKVSCDGQETGVRRIHLPRVRHLKIPIVNRNLFKGLKDMAFLEKFSVDSFDDELQEEEEEEEDEEEEEGLRWKALQKLHIVRLVFGEGFGMRNNPRLLHWFQHLTSLIELKLLKCRELYLPWRALIGLPNLQDVLIEEVEEVVDVDSDVMMMQTHPICRSRMELTIKGGSGEWVHDIPWKYLPFLTHLTLESLSSLKSLPEGIQHLSTLEYLYIHDIPNVVSLPDWMSSLSSLTHLDVTKKQGKIGLRFTTFHTTGSD